ncbi:YhzD family protein [Bacillus sp. Marseille-P3661]|uniref:YhzD family protein n=1 Tax=Bacillus sp. Marseille-P3661 TaxID=1936234 RepID=UPI000C84B64C|nr:YhzD family protein [Bacillus sp. Marseille-P3661]
MKAYILTVFDKKGKVLLAENFQAANDLEAKRIGETMLTEKEYLEYTHRCVSPTGKLLLFHA